MASPHKDNLSPGWVDQDQNEQDGSHQSSPFGNPVQPDPFVKNSSPVASQEDKKPSHHEIAGDASALFGETSHAADPFFSSIAPAQDSLSFFDNVGASATDKPFDNTKQTHHDTQYEYQSQQTYAQTTETNSVGQYYNPSQQSYDPSQQSYDPSQQSYDPSQQSYDPSQQSYDPSQQSYDPSQQAYNPSQQAYDPSQQAYDPSKQAYDPSQQAYDPSKQAYDPSQQAYDPSKQAYDPSQQAYDPSQQAYDPSQQAYDPSKQAYDPSQQAYDPSQQAYDPSQQAYDPSQQTYDPSQQWYTFDPNQHYYYDESGQLHFYDPNTGLDVDYQYPEATEEYQSDPQYAQYYDPNAYTASAQYAVDQPATTLVAHSDAQPQSGASTAHATDKPSHGTDSYLHDTQNYAPFEPSATVTDKSIPSFEAEHSHPPISTRVELNRGETVESWNNTHAISSGEHEATVPTIVQTTVTGVAEVPVMEEDEDDRKGGLPMKKSESEQMNVFQNELGASDGYMSVNQYETVSNNPPKSPSIHKEAVVHTDDLSDLNETVAWNTTQDPSDKYSPTHYQHQKEEFFYGEQNHETKEHMDTIHQKATEEQTEYNDNVESVNFNQYGPTYGSTDQSTARDVYDKDKSTLDTHAMTKDDIFSRYSNNHTNEQSVENVGDDLDDLVLGESDPAKDTKDHYPDYSNDAYNSSYELNAQQDYSTAYSPYNPTTTSAYEHSYETQTHQVSSTQYDTHETTNSADITKNESSHEPHTQQQDYSSQYDNNTTDSANYEKTYEPYGQQDYSAQYDGYNPSGEETKNYDPEASFEYQDQQDYSAQYDHKAADTNKDQEVPHQYQPHQDYSAQKDIRDPSSSEKQESYEPHAYQDNSAQYGAYNTTSSDRAVPYGGTNSYEPQPTQDLPNHSESDKTHSQLSTSHQEERTSYTFSSYSSTEPQISNTHRGSFPGTTQGYGAPFEGYNHMPLERSSTVPPPPISRMVTPQPDIPQRCPHPACEGENKARAKFCCECGRPLAGISRSTTPAAPSTQGFLSYTPLNAGLRAYTPPVIDAYPPEVQRYTPNHLHQNVQESHETAVRAFIPEHHSPYDNSYVENSMDNTYGEEPIPQSLELPQDPLKRHGGCPLISFGFGGKMCLMFPHTVQRFTTAGYDTSTPIIKKMPSAIKICHLRDVVGGDQDSTVRSMSSFVGPVLFDAKSSVKAKKKEVLAYMDKRLEEYDSLLNVASSNGESLDDIENKSLLWKLVKTLIEQEGSLGDNDKMDAAVRGLLWPVSATAAEEDNTNFSVPAYGQTTMASAEEEESDYSEIVLNKLQKFLENGDREGAVDYAVQEDMWAHALVISSCVNKELWKKVTNEFIERELCATVESKQTRVYHNVMGDKQALRVLYALFAGSGAGAMTEFVKSSEKHVTSHYGATPTTSPVSVEQLRQWRETLLLILANRTPRDVEAITALGDILKAQGWTGAAHFCYVVSPQSSLHSGIDAPHVRFTLLGVDGNNISKDLDGIHLSELYEYALSSKQATVSSLPFLQAYKLAYAWQLADYGFTALAQRYCEAIAGAIKANTKRTPWMHRQFVERLEEFAEICEISSGNSLSGDAGSWLKSKLAKNSLDSLWGSLEGRFNKFVSGDDAPAAEPVGRKSTEIMADGLPARSVSAFDFRNSGRSSVGPEHMRRSATPTTTVTAEGVALERQMTSSPYSRGPSSFEATRNATQSPSFNGQDKLNQGYGGYGTPNYGYGQDSARLSTATYSPFQQGGQASQAPGQAQNEYGYSPQTTPYGNNQNGGWWGADSGTDHPVEASSKQPDYQQQQQQSPQQQQQTPSMNTSSSYQPSSYAPSSTAATSTWTGGDDDDDLGFGNSSLRKDKPASNGATDGNDNAATQNEPEKEEEKPEEAKPEKHGWGIFSIFSRSSTTAKEDKKAIKANLGEQNNFYYDEKEKRWVNKLAENSTPAPAALPPPPKSSSVNTTRVSSPSGPPTPAQNGGPHFAPPSGPARMSSAPIPSTAPPLGGPNGMPPPAFGAPPPLAGKRAMTTGGRKPMRSRYVDVFNQPPSS